MENNPDQQAVFSFMHSHAVEDCANMTGRIWSSWAAWILDNPWFAQTLHDALQSQGFSVPQCAQAVSTWLSQCLVGYADVSSPNIDFAQQETWWQMQVSGRTSADPEVCHFQVRHAPSNFVYPPSGLRCIDALWRAESFLLVCHPSAPVLVATHHPQVDDDERHPENLDLEPSTHLGVETFSMMGQADRIALMARDNEVSDLLAQDAMASPAARAHAGPFYYTATLHQPAPALLAMRSSLGLDKHTKPLPSPGKSTPRL